MEDQILDDNLFRPELTTLEKHRLRTLEEQEYELDKKVTWGRNALFVLAVFSLISIMIMANQDFTVQEAVTEGVVMCVLYGGFALLSYRKPMIGIGLGLLIYLMVQIFVAMVAPTKIFSGIIFKAIFLYYLTMGAVSAHRLRAVQADIARLKGTEG